MLPLICLLCAFSSAIALHLQTIHEWNLIKYNTPPGYPGNASFRAHKALIESVDVGFDRIFFAVPKGMTDNPASLVHLPIDLEERDPSFEAYPSWEWHEGSVEGQKITEHTCRGFINVWKVRVDSCSRVWALDTGIFKPLSPARQVVCPPKLVAFDLNTHEEVNRIELRKDVVRVNSLVTNFVIDDTDETGAELEKCDVGHIYISDAETPAIIVYNMETEEMWRHSDPSFNPDPDYSKTRHATGESVVSMVGIAGMAISSPGLGAHRDLFYNPLASKTIYAVSTAALKNKPNPSYLLELPVRKVAEKPSQSWPMSYEPLTNSLLFSPWNETALMSLSLEDSKYRVLSMDPVALQGVTEITSATQDDNAIWVVSARVAKAVYDSVNPNEINQRLLRLNWN